jgi:hypothetical protein
MNADWRDDLNKLIAGGCGTQVGMFFTCATFAALFLFCMLCASFSALSITLNDLAESWALSPQTMEPFGESSDLQLTLTPMISSSTAISSPTALPVTQLPDTGAPTIDLARPKPIVTADQGRVNLRIGPGTNYPIIGLLPLNASLEIVGRNRDSTWWLVSTSEGLAWVYDGVVATSNLHDEIPIIEVNIPPPIGQPQFVLQPTATPVKPSATTNSPVTSLPVSGTPTASANENRIFVQQTVGYKRLREHLAASPTSANFSPRGDQIAIIEGIKLHIVAGDGSYSRVLLAENGILRPVGGAVWSPDGEYIAFMVDYNDVKCRPCRSVGLIRLADEKLTFLQTPDNMDSEAPRWTQDGRLLVNVHPGEPADGTTYVYNTAGQSQIASGTYVLSTSHDGQRWLPWLPGRTWQAGTSERPDTYYKN